MPKGARSKHDDPAAVMIARYRMIAIKGIASLLVSDRYAYDHAVLKSAEQHQRDAKPRKPRGKKKS
jgi:hypothetical protein